MSNSEIEQSGTVKGHLPNEASLSGRISNGLSLSGHISIGSGSGDFIIKMTVTSDDNGNYTVTSCDTTVEQIDAAVADEKRVVVIASYEGVIANLPMLQGVKGDHYYFGMFLDGLMMISAVYKVDRNTSEWRFLATQIEAESVNYSNAALPSVTNVKAALDSLVPNSHTHGNKAVLDKFSETDGKPTYNGEALGGGSGDFIIKMTVTSDDNGNYTVTSCDTTVEQIDAAVAAEKRVVVIATDTDNNLSWDIPIVQGFNGSNYYFATFLLGQAIVSFVQKVSENEARWQFVVRQIGSEFISYSNDAIPNISTVGEAIDELVPKSHTHANKAVLDKFAETDGKPTYDGDALGRDFVIKMTVEFKGSELIVTSCDTTVEQIDEAVVAEKRVVLVASVDGTILELPMVQGNKGSSYYFCAIWSESVFLSSVYKIENTSDWSFGMVPIIRDIAAEEVEYTNAILPDASNVKSALDDTIDTQQTQSADLESLRSGVSALLNAYETQGGDIASLKTQSHTHSNKDTLDKLSVADGKLQYNGSDVGLKGDKPVKGTDYWTESDKAEIVADTLAALPTWTGGSY